MTVRSVPNDGAPVTGAPSSFPGPARLAAAFAAGRAAGESFGDCTIRAGVVARTLTGLDFHSNIAPEARS